MCGRRGPLEGVDDPDLALDIISARGRADGLAGDREHGWYAARIGRYVLWSDSEKALASQSFATERAASTTL